MASVQLMPFAVKPVEFTGLKPLPNIKFRDSQENHLTPILQPS